MTVNRIWQAYFGQGLVATENDFGMQGDRPTHPELLDWLAGSSSADGWSLKALHRLIVTSATYRQSSHMRADLAAADPYNKLLGRQQRLRLEAEAIRDAALAASGLLTREIGGPGVYPPQPEGIYRFTQQVKFWGEKQGRRPLSPRHVHVFLAIEPVSVPDDVRRARRGGGLHAPPALEHAAASADAGQRPGVFRNRPRLCRPHCCARPGGRRRRRDRARRFAARWPASRRRASWPAWSSICDGERHDFAAAPQEAAPWPRRQCPPSDVDRAEAAAWTMLARVLLNLDEFITRE